MRRRVGLLCATLLVLHALGAPASASASRARKQLANHVEGEPHTFGIVAGIADHGGIHVVAHGRMGRDDDRAVDGDTLFEIGSVTKLFTALLLAEMVERGEVKLDEPVANLLPFPAAGLGPMTLLHLARHRSGLPREPGNYESVERYAPDSTYTAEQLFAFVSECRLESDPGSKFRYSNLGFGLLGQLLARRAGTDFESAVQARVLRPLGMRDTATRLSPEQSRRLAPGHLLDRTPVRNYLLEGIAGAGALKASANDMLRFLAANLGRTATSLSPAINRTQLGRPDFGPPNDSTRLAWSVAHYEGAEILYHGGKTWGYRSFVAVDRKRNRGVIVLSNSQHDIDDLGWALLKDTR